MFQIAAGLTLAQRNNTGFAAYTQKIMLPEPDVCLLSEYLLQFKGNILRNIDFINEVSVDVFKYNEPDSIYIPIKYRSNIMLDGYFQSEKYFDRDLIMQTYSIDSQTYAYIYKKYGDVFLHEVTSVNVRRGDFISLPEYHPVCSISYFRNAINYMGKSKNYLFISDDIEWCKKNFKGDNYYFIENENPTVDLYLQSLCANNIISNSSFSWWGAWLNTNLDKIVISPSENWVGKKHPVQNTKDLLPESWIKVPNPLNFNVRIQSLFNCLFQVLFSLKKVLKKNFNSEWVKYP